MLWFRSIETLLSNDVFTRWNIDDYCILRSQYWWPLWISPSLEKKARYTSGKWMKMMTQWVPEISRSIQKPPRWTTPSLYWGWLALPPSAVRTLRACGNDDQVVSLIVKWANSFLWWFMILTTSYNYSILKIGVPHFTDMPSKMLRPVGSYRDLCYLIYPHWLGIMITHSRETYQPTNIFVCIYIYIHSMSDEMGWCCLFKKILWMLKTAQNCSSGLWPLWISRVVTRSHESGCNPILAALNKYPILGICETHHFQVFGDDILNSCMMLGHLPTPVQPQPLLYRPRPPRIWSLAACHIA